MISAGPFQPWAVCDSVSRLRSSVCAVGVGCPGWVTAGTQHLCQARPGAQKLNRSHLQSNRFVPCPVSVRNSVESETIKSSSPEEPLTASISWLVCKGPFYCPHAALCTACLSLGAASHTRALCRAHRSCTRKASLWQQLPSIYRHVLAIVCSWNWGFQRLTFWSHLGGFSQLHKTQNFGGAVSKAPLLQISYPHFRLQTDFSTSKIKPHKEVLRRYETMFSCLLLFPEIPTTLDEFFFLSSCSPNLS